MQAITLTAGDIVQLSIVIEASAVCRQSPNQLPCLAS